MLQDPIFVRSGGTGRGRDGCRVPLPWSGTRPPFGFSPPGTTTWLPQPVDWAGLTAEAESADPGSTLAMHRDALRIRRSDPALREGEFAWVDSPGGVLAFDRGGRFRCVVNMSPTPVPLPSGEVLIASGPLRDGRLPTDTAAWIRRS